MQKQLKAIKIFAKMIFYVNYEYTKHHRYKISVLFLQIIT